MDNLRILRDGQHLRDVLKIPFSDEQMAAITSPIDTPGVIVAGAGSGKTAVMAARIVWLVGTGQVQPGEVLGLTFTNKAAGEFGSRVRNALEDLANDAGITRFLDERGEPTISTYHSYAGNLISEHGLRLGIETDLRITSDASRFQRVTRVVQTYRGPLLHVSTDMPTTVNNVMNLDGELSEHLITPTELRDFDEELRAELAADPKPQKIHREATETSWRRTELSYLVEGYREAKRVAGVMDFSDQMAWGAELAMSCPEVGASERDRFKVVLLDEYQDTSVAQRELLQAMYSGRDVESGRGHPITAVGDPTQAIYGWRGAAANNLADFLEHFPDEKGDTGIAHSLAVSRRCGVQILDVANTLAAPYYASTESVEPLRPPDIDDNQVPPKHPHEGTVYAASFQTVADEIDWLADRIQSAHGDGTQGNDHGDDVAPNGKGIAWNDMAILVRTGAEIGELTRVLRGRDIPLEVVGLNGLLAQPEIADIIATLEVIDNVTANPSLLRLLTGARWRIGARDLALLGRRARILIAMEGGGDGSGDLEADLRVAVQGSDPTEILSLADAMEDLGDLPYSDGAHRRFTEFASQLSRLRSHVSEPLADLARRTVMSLDLDVELGAQPGGAQALDNISLLIDSVADFAANAEHASLGGLLAYLRAESDYNDGMELSSPSESDSVKLLTAHRAKGLEWTAVFVPFISKSVFPTGRGRSRWITSASTLPTSMRGDAKAQPQMLDWTAKGVTALTAEYKLQSDSEELRLAYVAFTRAKQELTLSGHWWGRTQRKPRGPSDFLYTVKTWMDAKGHVVDQWAEQPGDDELNPLTSDQDGVAWPATLVGMDARRAAAQAVRDHIAGVGASPEAAGDEAEAAELMALDSLAKDLELLLEEADRKASSTVEVALPGTMSTTLLMGLAKDSEAVARDLARPMPRQPSSAARFGTRFHAWIETRFGQQSLLDPTDLPGQGDSDIAGLDDEAELREKFRSGEFGDRVPYKLEAPFSLQLGGQQIRGRIDAIYKTDDGFEVVDWKTNKAANADELQLAIYRLAWADLEGIDPAKVTGVFYYVRLGEVKRFEDLPGRKELQERLGF